MSLTPGTLTIPRGSHSTLTNATQSSCFHILRPHTAAKSKRKFLSKGMTKEAGINQPILQLRYGLDGQGMGVLVLRQEQEFFSLPQRSCQQWGQTSLPFNMYRGIFVQSLSGRSVNLTTHFYLVSKVGRLGVISGKAILVQAWTGSGGYKRMKFLDFKTIGK